MFCKSKGTTVTSCWLISAVNCSISRIRFYSALRLYFWTSYFSAALLYGSVLWTHIHTGVLIFKKDKQPISCSSFRTFFPLTEIKTSFLNSVLKFGFISKTYKEKKLREKKDLKSSTCHCQHYPSNRTLFWGSSDKAVTHHVTYVQIHMTRRLHPSVPPDAFTWTGDPWWVNTAPNCWLHNGNFYLI